MGSSDRPQETWVDTRNLESSFQHCTCWSNCFLKAPRELHPASQKSIPEHREKGVLTSTSSRYGGCSHGDVDWSDGRVWCCCTRHIEACLRPRIDWVQHVDGREGCQGGSWSSRGCLWTLNVKRTLQGFEKDTSECSFLCPV